MTGFSHRTPSLAPRCRLLCLPYAGGNASLFLHWQQQLGANVEVCPVELPGRVRRINEPPFRDARRAADALAGLVQPLLDRPIALFGHSMGAVLAFELARLLEHEAATVPLILFVSAARPPHVRPPERNWHLLPDDDLVRALEQLGGTPRSVLENQELLRVILPTLRADFELVQTYRYVPGPKLRCRIHAFAGQQDAQISAEVMSGWRDTSLGSFQIDELPGDHFFVDHARVALVELVARALDDACGSPWRSPCTTTTKSMTRSTRS